VEELSANWNFTVCAGFDEALDHDRIANVAAACGCAETRPLTDLIGGHASSTTQEIQVTVHPLSWASVAEAIWSVFRFPDALAVVIFGKRRPAIKTADVVPEPKNRRVLMSGICLEPQDAQTSAR
jgi:hypothetical protein